MPLAWGAGCSQDDPCAYLCSYDDPPSVVILSPQADLVFAVDAPIAFEGLVADDGPLTELVAQWLVDDEVVDEPEPDVDGRVVYEASIADPGAYNVELRAFDVSGNQAMDAVAIDVESATE